MVPSVWRTLRGNGIGGTQDTSLTYNVTIYGHQQRERKRDSKGLGLGEGSISTFGNRGLREERKNSL